jgi:dihydroorotate dehydrogenase electron transfer subunit
MTKRIEDFIITENIHLTDEIFILEITSLTQFDHLKPGQFVQIKIEGSQETFLRRPFSIHDVNYEKNSLRLLIQVAGRGTQKLSDMQKGASLNIIYPLGNSFSIPSSDAKILLIGGGCGVAPLLFLGKYLKSTGFNPGILLGFRNSKRIIEFDEYNMLGPVYLTTEDGSKGEKGFVTDHSILNKERFDKIFCCGPEPMMKSVAKYCIQQNIDCEVSLEKLMACGFGVCLCCIVSTVHGNLCTCTDGPIFNIKDLKW